MKHIPLLSTLTILLVSCGGGEVAPSSSLSSAPTSILPSSSTPSSSENIIVGISRALFGYLSELPSTDTFLPAFVDPETYLTTKNVETLDYYANAVNKSDLPTIYFGAQLDQLRTHIGLMDGFTQDLTTMLSHAATLGDVYSDYLSEDPSNPYQFSVTLGGFAFSITGLENELVVEVSVGGASVTMAVLNIQGVITYWIDVYITDTNRLVIYTTPTRLVIIGSLLVSEVQVSYLLEIVKSGNQITGYSYERYGIDSVALKNHVVFKTDGNYFVVAGERGDFILGAEPKVNVETYELTTGKYLGSQVLETIPVTGPTYETVWYPMWSLNGWTSIQFELDNSDSKEFPQVYLNGSSSAFDVHYNSVFGVSTSRKYDIELKKSYAYVLNNDGDLEKKEFLYPGLFIQENELTSNAFGTVNSRNGNIFTHTLTSNQLSAIRSYFDTMKTEQSTYKQVNVDTYISDFLIALAS